METEVQLCLMMKKNPENKEELYIYVCMCVCIEILSFVSQ